MTIAVKHAGSTPHGASFKNLGTLRERLDGPHMLSAIVTILLVIAIVPPICILFYQSIIDVNAAGSATNFTLRHYRAIFAEEGFFAVGYTSVVFAGVTTVIALLLGGSVAWLVERTDAPGKSIAYITTIVSMAMPGIVYVTGWIYLLGRNGPVNMLYRSATGNLQPLFDVFSLPGMILIEGLLWSPMVFLLLSATFRAANAEMEEAARMAGAMILTTVRKISMRLAWPAVLALALFIFVRNLEVFEIPALVGLPGNVKVFTTDIYFSLKQVPPQLGHASAFSVVLVLIVALLLSFYSRVARQADRYASVTGKGYRPRPFQLGAWRWGGGAILAVNSLLVLGLPLAALIWTSLLPFAGPVSMRLASQASFRNYELIFNAPYYLKYAINTVVAAGGAATVVMLVALVGGWLAARRKPGGAAIDQIAMTPLVFPGVVLGVAMIQTALRAPFPLYGSLWLLILAFFVRYLPYGMRYSYSGVLQIHRELEEAGSVAGSTTLGTLRRIVAPLLTPALLSGWLFIFLIASKELSVAILLAGPQSQMMAVVIFDMWVNGQAGQVSALGLMWTLVMTLVASGFYFLIRSRTGQAFSA